MRDTYWAAGSAAFVLIYMIINMRSFVLGFYAIALILFSFPVTQLLYRGAFGIQYFATIHHLIIFITLGMSADSFFIIHDAWRQTAKIPQLRDHKRLRMAFAFKKAGKAIFVTSLTTAGAFLANLVSKIMPIKAFGVYAAIIVPVNFILVAFMFPPMLVFYDDNLRERRFCKMSRAEKRRLREE